jgi:hypothetical protein
MNHNAGLQKIKSFFIAIKTRSGLSGTSLMLLLFLTAVMFVSFAIPFIDFGRLYGTDDYTHLYHTGIMSTTTSLSSFYDTMGDVVSNSDSDVNPFNYPFGLWLFGSMVAKITGLSPIDATFLFTLVFSFLLIGSFYFYSGMFFESRSKKLLATLLFISMPNMALLMLSFRPSVFILPFLFMILYIAYKEPVDWRLLPFMVFSIFIIVISHTGTFIFLLILSTVYFFLYCLLWGKFSRSFFIVIISSLVLYVISLNWFPQIANQYADKSSLFLTTSNFLATKFNLHLAGDLGKVFYQNLFVGQELVYAIIFGAIIFSVGKALLYIHNKTKEAFKTTEKIFPVSLPITNISHSLVATPIWIGPVQTLLSFVGYFYLDSKGKCLLISALLCTLLPDMFQTAQGIFAATGALREVSYLVIIIPVTASLGFFGTIDWIREGKSRFKKILVSVSWVILLLSVILVPTLATTYYLPKIAGENYIIDGMKWLGQTGDATDKVVGYGYRTVPIYTNMTDASYGLQSGTETRTFRSQFRGLFFSTDEKNADNFLSIFGARYVMSSDKIISNFGNTTNVTIDNNTALNKIYSSNDFGIYDIDTASHVHVSKQFLAENVSIEKIGSTFTIESPVYKLILDENSPTIERIGTPQENVLGEGFSTESIQISEAGGSPNPWSYSLDNMNFSQTIEGDRLIYRTTLAGQGNFSDVNEESVVVQYRFYPDAIEREYVISNDWKGLSNSSRKSVSFITNFFSPLSDFVIKNDDGRLERHIYESQDAIIKNTLIKEFYIHDRDTGIYVTYSPTSPYPTNLIYKGSTLYNMSSVRISQSDNVVKSGASLHVTQFISVGDEMSAQSNIENHHSINLMKYPGGIIPIVMTGYLTPMIDQFDGDAVSNGYDVIRRMDIDYSEAVNPVQNANANDTVTMPEETDNPDAVQNTTHRQYPPIDLQNITRQGIKIIGVQSVAGRLYDDFDTQTTNIGSLLEYAKIQNVPLIGFMPTSLNYNFDTISVLTKNNVPFVLASSVSSPYRGSPQDGYRNPEIAYYNGQKTNIVLLPISYPTSSTLMNQKDPSTVFTRWRDTIDQAARNEEMVLFLFRANDIGNPDYTDGFANLTTYARDKGLTFTSPDVIASHFQKLQNIDYSGSISNDIATIRVTNKNREKVSNVTFQLKMPILQNGEYTATNGTVLKKNETGSMEWIYVTTSLPQNQSTLLTISPNAERENLLISIPSPAVEGPFAVTVRDTNGKVLPHVEVIFDTKHYLTDSNGRVGISVRRGPHTITVQNPGYNSYTRTFTVKGRYYLIENFFTNLKI